eukprot:scaffold22560_cov135-Cylindrotheca_fusiformis.AAC.12
MTEPTAKLGNREIAIGQTKGSRVGRLSHGLSFDCQTIAATVIVTLEKQAFHKHHHSVISRSLSYSAKNCDSAETMVLFMLYMKADTENIQEIQLRRTANLRVSIRHPQGDEVRENVVFNPSETIEQEEGSREPAHHFRLKWEGSKKASTLQVLDEKEVAATLKKKKYKGDRPRAYTGEDSGNWVPVLAMECRGIEPFSFHPMSDEFVITSEGGFVFNEDIELGDGDWAEYDAENDVPVSLEDVSFKFEAI